MEGFLRLGLLFVAVIIIFFIFFDAWHRRRRAQLSSHRFVEDTDSATPSVGPSDFKALGLARDDSRENFLQNSVDIDEHNPFVINASDVVPEEKYAFHPSTKSEYEHEYESELQPSGMSVTDLSPPEKMASDLRVIKIIAKPGNQFASYDLLQAIYAAGMQFGDMNIFHYYISTQSGNRKLFSLVSATEPGDFDLDRIGDFSCHGLMLFMRMNEVPDPERAFAIMLTTAEQLADDLEGELQYERSL